MPGPRGSQAPAARPAAGRRPLLTAGLRFACHLSAPAPKSARLPPALPGRALPVARETSASPRRRLRRAREGSRPVGSGAAAAPPFHPPARFQGPCHPGRRGGTGLRGARGYRCLPARGAGPSWGVAASGSARVCPSSLGWGENMAGGRWGGTHGCALMSTERTARTSAV